MCRFSSHSFKKHDRCRQTWFWKDKTELHFASENFTLLRLQRSTSSNTKVDSGLNVVSCKTPQECGLGCRCVTPLKLNSHKIKDERYRSNFHYPQVIMSVLHFRQSWIKKKKIYSIWFNLNHLSVLFMWGSLFQLRIYKKTEEKEDREQHNRVKTKRHGKIHKGKYREHKVREKDDHIWSGQRSQEQGHTGRVKVNSQGSMLRHLKSAKACEDVQWLSVCQISKVDTLFPILCCILVLFSVLQTQQTKSSSCCQEVAIMFSKAHVWNTFTKNKTKTLMCPLSAVHVCVSLRASTNHEWAFKNTDKWWV